MEKERNQDLLEQSEAIDTIVSLADKYKVGFPDKSCLSKRELGKITNRFNSHHMGQKIWAFGETIISMQEMAENNPLAYDEFCCHSNNYLENVFKKIGPNQDVQELLYYIIWNKTGRPTTNKSINQTNIELACYNIKEAIFDNLQIDDEQNTEYELIRELRTNVIAALIIKGKLDLGNPKIWWSEEPPPSRAPSDFYFLPLERKRVEKYIYTVFINPNISLEEEKLRLRNVLRKNVHSGRIKDINSLLAIGNNPSFREGITWTLGLLSSQTKTHTNLLRIDFQSAGGFLDEFDKKTKLYQHETVLINNVQETFEAYDKNLALALRELAEIQKDNFSFSQTQFYKGAYTAFNLILQEFYKKEFSKIIEREFRESTEE